MPTNTTTTRAENPETPQLLEEKRNHPDPEFR